MSLPRSAQCIFCAFRGSFRSLPTRRKFHASSAQLQSKRKKLNNKAAPVQKESIKPYSEEERQILREVYTEAQIAALEQGENSVSIKDITKQAGPDRNPWKLPFVDELTELDPVVDHPVRAPETNFDPYAQLRDEEDIAGDIATFVQDLSEEATFKDYKDFDKSVRMTKGKEEAELNPRSVIGPELFEKGEQFDPYYKVSKISKQAAKKVHEESSIVPLDKIDPELFKLMQATGYSQEEIKNIRVKGLVERRVANQTRLGKIHKMYILSVAGNENGLLGIGEAKSFEAEDAMKQSKYRAIRNMRPIMRYEKRTVFGDLSAKVGATELQLYHRPPGYGLRCHHLIWEIARCAGIQDLGAKVMRARNGMNTVKAAVKALMGQRNPEDIARARGKKLVDVRKVYYAGGLAESTRL